MKAAIYTANSTAATLGANATLPLGAIIRRYGCALDLNGNGVNLLEQGYYAVDASISYAPTAAGAVTVTLMADGVAVPGATATATAAAAGDTVNLSIVGMVKRCCNGAGTILLMVDQAGVLGNVALRVSKGGCCNG